MVNPLVSLGRWDEALTTAEEARGTLFAGGYHGPETMFTSWVHVARGEPVEARDVLTTTDESESEDVQTRAAWHAKNAAVCRAENNLDAALASAMIAFDARADVGPGSPMTKDGFVEACETGLAMGDLDKVQELLDIVHTWRPGEVTPYLRAQAERFAARLEAARGKDPTLGMRAALREFTELLTPFWTAVTSLELAEWLLIEGRNAEAAPLVEESRKIFKELGAQPWLERLESCGALDVLAQAT
jgi:hypothetical protein